ncbi:hypothetical protein B591N_N00014b [Streptomyces albus subsp. chlorinus]|uniref:Uncharacterized protein n=1 Tax=Streptomyces albus subsp. chlorinus TaxID=337066 RepID=A0A3G4YJE8_9ACTN|nr:hypothetical protein [Streptomyces albus subsp. chlorinus]UZN59896.1 hypothetical protein B591N_N00014a [Streptomyces albus subsp. chlorinus] [Streptomyces sp. GBA 94-10 4N24]UZQ37589.1 hypothetical protein SLV14N_N0014 [Streptomyces albus subsp. chlorinus] [Streptomyces sp. Je 1-4 4N24]UZQ45006.1 hypothetical protein SLV14NA_N0014 [Streptomyces albus subsp. chlorinus] [Streptomyces sp. Je 1-4 4N24_ara]WAE20009.1 hypothetical protein SAD14N_N00014a [Streptomyces albus subsp. chlorinus] [Stre
MPPGGCAVRFPDRARACAVVIDVVSGQVRGRIRAWGLPVGPAGKGPPGPAARCPCPGPGLRRGTTGTWARRECRARARRYGAPGRARARPPGPRKEAPVRPGGACGVVGARRRRSGARWWVGVAVTCPVRGYRLPGLGPARQGRRGERVREERAPACGCALRGGPSRSRTERKRRTERRGTVRAAGTAGDAGGSVTPSREGGAWRAAVGTDARARRGRWGGTAPGFGQFPRCSVHVHFSPYFSGPGSIGRRNEGANSCGYHVYKNPQPVLPPFPKAAKIQTHGRCAAQGRQRVSWS